MKNPPCEYGEEAMEESDLPSLWETKNDADILLTMGASKWELHDKAVRGKSGLIDHILEMVQMKEGMRKIPLKERMFPHSALNTVLKYFYFGGESLITEKTEVIDLLSLYEVSATLGILPLQERIAFQAGYLLGEILSSGTDRMGDFYIVIEVIIAEQDDLWVFMHEEMQRALSPYLLKLLPQDTFVDLIKQNPAFCLEILSTAVDRIEILEDATKEVTSVKGASDVGTQAVIEHGSGIPRPYVEAGTQADIPLPHTPKTIPSATGDDDQHPCSDDETIPRPRKRVSMSIPGPANKSRTAENPNPTSKDARVSHIPQDFKFDFQAKSSEVKSISTGINQSQVCSLSATPKVVTGNGAVPNVRPQSSSSSHASTHWESCSEGGERAVPVTEMSKSITTSASVELSSHIGVAPESQSKDEKAQVGSGNKKDTILGNLSLNFSSHIQGGCLPISLPEDSGARQTEQTAVPASYERSSRSYALKRDSLPRGFQFFQSSSGPQPGQCDVSTSKAASSHSQENKTAVTGVVERQRREYVLRGSEVTQTEGISAPAIPERPSRPYGFHSADLPRSFKFSEGAQGEHSKEPSVKASGSKTPNTKASTSCAQQSTSSSSHTRVKPSPWKADKATAKQMRKGRLIVEPPGLLLTITTEIFSSSRTNFNLEGDNLEECCKPS
ncbi:uncharacterized protein CCOS01_15662 [Colletotrichum costaricense]|uniref:BTB domain-containing protein n=1 Tax=Colletotrichum costaricense TaxID=1209916 RepID=A0AAJ0DT26_9PEZI|nr:uncharacterized protein CCOS01_15662 [Colletotrichum costaricense]KAK1509146.1 hypothetical protein CCOS01_15662 [Colletotrichum costaricense]